MMTPEQIRSVRSFNRTVTHRIGALNESFLDRGRPLGEARLLYEIGHDGSEVRRLRETLALDSGYLSRLLKSLERQGLVRVRRATADRRFRFAILTCKGQEELAEYDRRSDNFVKAVLAPLNTSQRDRLVSAMADVERLLRAAAVEIRIEQPDDVDASWCLQQYFRELDERFERGFDPSKGISANADELSPPAGCFVVARLDGQPIGCGALKLGNNGVGEIKRMWVRASVRGLGVGRRILENLEDQACNFGLTVLRLETNRALTEAQALYRTAGYREVAPFNGEPHADHWFEKAGLGGGLGNQG